MPENLERLRSRGLSTKQHWPCGSLRWVWRATQRFVDRGPLYRVHECAFAVLTLKSEPVDPRL